MSIVFCILISAFLFCLVSVIVCVGVSVICLLLDIEVSLCSSVLTQFSSMVAFLSRSFNLIVLEHYVTKLMIFVHK